MTHTFLLEIGLEEMPASVINPSALQLKDRIEAFLNEAGLSYQQVTPFSTPRRLAVKVEVLAEVQPDDRQLVKGPAKRIAQDSEGNWTKAAIGFTKGQGASTEDIVFQEVKGEEYIFVEKFTKGKNAAEILPGLADVITSVTFPVSMKWNTYSYKFIRPIHWIVALLDQKVVPFEVFGVNTGQQTSGHRFLGEPVTIDQADHYIETLKGQYVLADREERKTEIADQITALCQKHGWKVPLDNQELLDEVTDLVEWPTVFYGSFNDAFLDVPEAVLEVSMADHQRYFPVRNSEDGETFLPHFIGVRNGSADHLDKVAKGNEKVLAARLADAKFFYKEDQEKTIDECVDQLKKVSFHEKLGSIYDKQKRIGTISHILADEFDLSKDEKAALERASELLKFDLVTSTVIEFTKLQGKIGAILAKEKGEDDLVCQAVSEQYLPTSATGELPSTAVGTVLSMADKLDTLVMFIAIDQVPSGSNDPFALRRQAMGIVRMIENTGRHFSLKDILNKIEEQLQINVELKAGIAQNQPIVLQFINDRLDQYLQQTEEMGVEIPYDIRQAVLNSNQSDLVSVAKAAHVLTQEKENDTYKPVTESLTRAANLALKADEDSLVDSDLFETESEKTLYHNVQHAEETFQNHQEPSARYQALKELSPSIDAFFDENMVMADDQSIKYNRLALLKQLNQLTSTLADFSYLVIKS